MVDELFTHRDKLKLVKLSNNDFTLANENLSQKTSGLFKTGETLKENEQWFRKMLENSHDVIVRANLNEQNFEYVSQASIRLWGYTPEDVGDLSFDEIINFVHPDDQERVKQHFKEITKHAPRGKDVTIEMRVKHKTRDYRWMSSTYTLVFDEKNHPVAIVCNVRDIHRSKQAELVFQKSLNKLEIKVKEYSVSLEQANNALRLMLKKEEEIKAEFENKILCNVKQMVLPFVRKLKTSKLDRMQRRYLSILESRLNEILSPFSYSLTKNIRIFTPGEIKIANLLKDGMDTKEIANLLNLSTRAIEFHRASIRKKLGIKNKKTNLRSKLLSLFNVCG